MRPLFLLRVGHHDPRKHPADQPPASRSGTGVGRIDTADLAREITAAVNFTRLLAAGDTALHTRIGDAVEPYVRPGERDATVTAVIEELLAQPSPGTGAASTEPPEPAAARRLWPHLPVILVMVLVGVFFGILTQLDRWGTTGLLVAVAVLIVAATTAIISLLVPALRADGRA